MRGLNDPDLYGKPVTRLEDRRLLTGAGSYIDDVKLPGISTMAILRSPMLTPASGASNLRSARAMEGVIDAFCAADLDAQLPVIPLRLAPFDGFERFLQRPIAVDKVRYVGEPVAVVIAEDRYVAEDALELIEVEFDQLPTITTIEQAAAGNTLIHEVAAKTWAPSTPSPAATPIRRSTTQPIRGANASSQTGTARCQWKQGA